MRHGASGLPTEAPWQTKQQQVDLGGRLGEREVRRPQPGHDVRAEHLRGEVVERALQVRHRDARGRRRAPRPGRTPGCASRRARRCGTCARARSGRSAARCVSIVRACTGEVCVRSTRPLSGGSTKNVSCMLRAGWSGEDVERVEVEPLGLDLGAVGDLVARARRRPRRCARRAVTAGAGRPTGQRSYGSVTSTASSTSTARVPLGLELGLPGLERGAHLLRAPDRPAARPRPWPPAAAHRSRGWPAPAATGRRRARAARP